MKNNNTSKLVFIAGLGHSGSTLLDLLLGAQPGVTGLGEIDVFINTKKRDWFLERFDKYPCTCGRRPSECPVWGGVKPYIEENSQKSYGEIYSKIFEIVVDKTGSDIIVDSSKNLHSLKKVYDSLPAIGLSEKQFYVIHLVKDERSFTAPSLRAGRNKSILRVFRSWTKATRKFDHYLQSNRIKMLRVGSDELVLSTEYVMGKVSEFISDGKNDRVILDLTKTGSHIISGNKMRLDHADGIRYDYRWFNDSKINFYYSFFSKLKRLNKEWVYHNVNHFVEARTRFKTSENKS